MKRIHLRDPEIPKVSLCFDQRVQEWQLTSDPKQVTCGRCRQIIERKKKA
ncbi:hypothetical protein ES708_29549 [subsurface metagenome]